MCGLICMEDCVKFEDRSEFNSDVILLFESCNVIADTAY